MTFNGFTSAHTVVSSSRMTTVAALQNTNWSYFELNILFPIHCRLFTLITTYTWFTQRYYVGYTNAPKHTITVLPNPNWGCISEYDLQHYRDKGYHMITVPLNFHTRYNVSYNCLKIIHSKLTHCQLSSLWLPHFQASYLTASQLN